MRRGGYRFQFETADYAGGTTCCYDSYTYTCLGTSVSWKSLSGTYLDWGAKSFVLGEVSKLEYVINEFAEHRLARYIIQRNSLKMHRHVYYCKETPLLRKIWGWIKVMSDHINFIWNAFFVVAYVYSTKWINRVWTYWVIAWRRPRWGGGQWLTPTGRLVLGPSPRHGMAASTL